MKFLKEKSKFILMATLAIIIIAVIAVNSAPRSNAIEVAGIHKLEKMELVDNINIKGVVVSSDSQSIYSTLGYEILSVNVEVGDKVSAGDSLMVLDTTELEGSIAENRARLDKQSESNLVQLENAQRQLNEASSNYSNSQDSSIISARSRIESAKSTLDNAQKNYDQKYKEIHEEENSQLVNAESSLRNAENSLRNAEIELEKATDDYEKNKTLFQSGVISQHELDLRDQALTSTKNAVTDAKSAVTDAHKNIDLIKSSISKEINSYEQSLDSAKIAYNEALDSLTATERSLEQSVEKHRDSVKSAEVAINADADLISIQNLENRLAKANVTSPISGTVTAVYAKEGSSASGLMFVIEDTSDLIIETKIKEFDANEVKEGMEVTIKSDATGNDEYSGIISKIAPTSTKNAQGQTTLGSEVEFATEVKVISEDTALKIGMNTKLTVQLEKREDVLAIPFDVLAEDADGNDIIYIVENANVTQNAKTGQSEMMGVAKAIKVNLLFETDFYAEIEGDGIKEGLEILSDISNVTEGAEVKVLLGDLNE